MANYAGLPISGAGGYAVLHYYYPSNVYVAPPGALTASAFMLIDNTNYNYNAGGPVFDVTTSNSGNNNESVGGISKCDSLTIDLPDDDPSSVDAGILVIGAKYVVWLKRGAHARFDVVIGAVFRGVSVTNNNQDGEPRRLNLNFEGGFLARSQLRGATLTYKGQSWAGGIDSFLSSLTPAR